MPVFGTLLALLVVAHLTGHAQDFGQSAVGVWLGEAKSQATRIQPPPANLPPSKNPTPEEKAMVDRMMQPLQMTRVGAPAPNAAPIVGTWSYTHYTGATAYELYTRGGAMVLMAPMQVQPATYSKRGNAFTLHLPKGTATMVAKGDVLTLASPDGQSSTYRRAPR